MPTATSVTRSPPRAAAASLRVTGCTCQRVRTLARQVTQVYDRALAPSGLRVTQFSLMSHLLLDEGSAIAPLASALDMDRTTLTRNLKPLVEAGLVDLSTNARDARVRLVRLTATGRSRHRQAMGQWRHAQDRVNALLGHSEVASLHRLFDDLIRTFHEPVRAVRKSSP